MGKLLHRLKRDHRTLLLHACGWVHCALLGAILLTGIVELLTPLGLHNLSLDSVFLRGLLFVIPAALSHYAAERIRRLWLYLPASLGIAAISWLLLGNPGGAVLAAALCLFRMMSRMAAKEEEAPVVSAFDAPHYAGLFLFGITFLISAAGGFSILQRSSVIAAVFYLLLCFLYSGIQRVDGYLTLNREMANLPGHRIERAAGSAVVLAVVLAAALLLPAAFGTPGDFRIDLSRKRSTVSYTPPELQATDPGTMAENLEELYDDLYGPAPVMPQWVNYLLTAIAAVCVLATVIYAVYAVSRHFRSSFRDNQDVVQYLGSDLSEDSPFEKRGRKRSWLFDRSPGALIRRCYRKRVLRGSKEPPKRWQSPAELEAAAGLENAQLHSLYEKARYSAEPCTAEDVRLMREAAKKA